MYQRNEKTSPAIKLGILICFASLIPFSYSYSEPDPKPPGELHDLGGYNIHIIRDGTGSPSVLFFHGEGDIALIWNLVLPEVGEFATAVAIDKPGMGWSDYGHNPNTLRQQAYDAMKALHVAEIKPPYIVVGHSVGGLVAYEFTKQFRDDIAGMVLVDASHPGMMLRYRQKDGSFKWQQVRDRAEGVPIPPENSGNLDTTYEYGTFISNRDTEEKYAKFSARDQEIFYWFYNREVSYAKGTESLFPDELQMISLRLADYHIGEVPLVVISAGQSYTEGDSTYSTEYLLARSDSLHNDHLKRSDNSSRIIADSSGHAVLIDQPELIVDVIRKMVDGISSE